MTKFDDLSIAACGTLMAGGTIASFSMLSKSAAGSAAVGAEIACGTFEMCPGLQLNLLANSGTSVICGPAGSMGLPGGICLPTAASATTKATLTAKTATGLKAVLSSKTVLGVAGVGSKAAASVALKSAAVFVAAVAPIAVVVVGAVACGFVVKKLLKK